MRTCSITDCNNIHWGKSYCRMHYARWYKHGNALISKRVVGENRIKHPLYKTFVSMHQRCDNSNAAKYEYYGGRGISVCSRWTGKQGFSNFILDMGERPDNYSLDRIDNNGHYTLKNCRWASRTTQAINKRILSRNKSGVTGVYWYKDYQKWAVEIGINGKRIKLGYFAELIDATNARKDAELKYHAPILELV